MQYKSTFLALALAMLSVTTLRAQDIYSTTGGGFIFGLNESSFSE